MKAVGNAVPPPIAERIGVLAAELASPLNRGPAYLDSAITLGDLLAHVEADDLPLAWIEATPGGGVLAHWCGTEGRSVAVACQGRRAVVTARIIMTPNLDAFLVRDERGKLVCYPKPRSALSDLRTALGWLTGGGGASWRDVIHDAGRGWKRI
jgi:hypothetical protein